MTHKEFFKWFNSMQPNGKSTQMQVDGANGLLVEVDAEVLKKQLSMINNWSNISPSSGGDYILTEESLKSIYSKADTRLVDIINKHSTTFGITTKKRMAMFLAHAIHESSGFTRLSESLNYSPERLRAVFPTRIPSLNFATNIIAKGQKEVANHLYGGRYGNRPNTDDGWNYRGRGIGGLTFRGNYIEMQEVLREAGLEYNIVDNPELLSDKEVATLTYMAYWYAKGLNEVADKGDIVKSTKIINGGSNGLADRRKLYELALKKLQ